ncbi:MAG: 2-hydroxychromene-2-carboxylate isomerase [Alphaproteobacteria bacterium]|nr:2-hydroxychromene-2-carboxylate isomerase [Alphaproteobacteria bacterium]
MSKTIDYYFCLNSPWVYLGQKRLEEIALNAGATIRYHPVDLKEMMLRLLGSDDPPERSDSHRKYGKLEMRRWAEFRGLAISDKPRYYPVAQSRAARLVIAAERFGADPAPLVFALPRAVWAEDRNINDSETLQAIADENGYAGDILLAASEDKAVREQFEMNTDEAIRRDVFGIPTYVSGDTLLWGQDRLDFLERALAA